MLTNLPVQLQYFKPSLFLEGINLKKKVKITDILKDLEKEIILKNTTSV